MPWHGWPPDPARSAVGEFRNALLGRADRGIELDEDPRQFLRAHAAVLRRDAERLRQWVAQGAIVRVCGSRAMAQGVAEALDTVLAPLHLSVSQLKAKERYAEDVF